MSKSRLTGSQKYGSILADTSCESSVSTSNIGTNVDQVLGKIFVQQARGQDKFKYHEYTKRPVELMSKKDIELKNKANEELSKIFYKDTK